MFPIADETLTFSEIADYWSRELTPPASDLELLRLLERAWWRGQIVGETALTRLKLIQYLFRHAQDFPVVFVIGEESGTPVIEKMADGSVEVDLWPRLHVPSADPETWNDTSCGTTYDVLAQAQCLMADPTVGPALRGINLSQREFMNWLEASGYAKPRFWATETVQKGRAGRKPRYDWGKIEEYVVNQLNKNGHWDDSPEDGWRSQNDLVHQVQEYCGLHYDKEPVESTVKARLPPMIERWHKQSAGN
jgi:hypothetical protein